MRQYVVDAFTGSVFAGNPAAVCVLEEWPDEALMQAVAVENNLSETAFAVPRQEPGGSASYDLRWFTPGGEVDLCGHATLATAFVVLEAALDDDAVPTVPASQAAGGVVFHTLSGPLHVTRRGSLREAARGGASGSAGGSVYEMALPAYELVPVLVTPAMERAYGARPSEAWLGRDLVCVFDDEAQVRALRPDQQALSGLEGLLQHATALTAEGAGGGREEGLRPDDVRDSRDVAARGRDSGGARGAAGTAGDAAVTAGDGAGSAEDAPDCVSRSFAPRLGVAEDPVCGSGHCHIVPLWAPRLGRRRLVAYQASARGGTLYCRHEPGQPGSGQPGRVYLAGEAVVYSVADLVLGWGAASGLRPPCGHRGDHRPQAPWEEATSSAPWLPVPWVRTGAHPL